MKKYIRIFETAVGIEWYDDRLTNFIGLLYRPWQVENANHDTTITIEIHDHKYIISGKNDRHSCTSQSMAALIVEFMITQYVLKASQHYLLLHACTIEYNGKAAIVIGDHGKGKTTLACAAITHGMKAVADDITILCNDHRTLIGCPRPFKITHDTWNMKPSIIPKDCPFYATEDDTLLFFHEPACKYYAPESTVNALYFLTRHDGPTICLTLGEIAAIQRIIPQGFNFYVKQNTLLDTLHDLFRTFPPQELLYSNNIDAVNQIKSSFE